LYAKLSKCSFFQRQIHYLDHIVLEEGITVDPEKIKSTEGWPTPRNVSEVRSFMGLAGYYRRSIEGFSKFVHPITSLQKKGVKFEWNSECEERFQHLNNLLTSAPILNIVDPNEDFIVCIDACKQGIGGVLTRNGHVICHESRKLKEHERQYATHDLESTTIVHVFKTWRHYLMGKIFELRIDHSGLKYLFGQPTLNARQIRWLEFLSEYDFDIKNIKGKENKVVDALDKRVHKMHATTISMYKTDLKDKILVATKSDQHYVQTIEKLQQGNSQQKFKDYDLSEDGILVYMGRVYVPNFQELKIWCQGKCIMCLMLGT
jgi:hypothetical protein